MIRTTLLAAAAAATMLLGNFATSGTADAARVGVFIGIGNGHLIRPHIVVGQHRHRHCHTTWVKKKGKKLKVKLVTCHTHWHYSGHH